MFIGYSLLHKEYRFYHPQTRKVFISRHVIFYEFILLYESSRTGLSANLARSYCTTFYEFLEHQYVHSLVVTPLDNSTECSIPPTFDCFHESSCMQQISPDLLQLGSSNMTPIFPLSVSNLRNQHLMQ